MSNQSSQLTTLVIGGARSGKSRYAEQLIASLPSPWVYMATAQRGDDEMVASIAEHQARRGDGWQTVEAPLDLADRLKATGEMTVLVDCLTLWLSNVMFAERNVDDEIDHLTAIIGARKSPLVLVSNEVGFGIVPDNALARRFRDLQGRLNQRVAACVHRVVLVVAGMPLVMKGKR